MRNLARLGTRPARRLRTIRQPDSQSLVRVKTPASRVMAGATLAQDEVRRVTEDFMGAAVPENHGLVGGQDEGAALR